MRRSRVRNPPTSRPRPSTISSWTGVAPAADAAKADAPKASGEGRPRPSRADVVTAPATDTNKADTAKKDTATTSPAAPPPAAATATPAAEPVKAASNVPAADQPVADKLKDLLGGKSARYFDRKAERTAVEKFYTARDFAPLWTQRRRADRDRQGRHRAAEGRRLRRPQSRRLSGAGFRRRHHSRCAGGSRSETDRQHAGLCAPGAERPDALVAGLRRHPVSGTSDRSHRGADQCHHRQGRLGGARQLQPAAEALSGIEGEARRTARPGRRHRSSRSPTDRR